MIRDPFDETGGAGGFTAPTFTVSQLQVPSIIAPYQLLASDIASPPSQAGATGSSGMVFTGKEPRPTVARSTDKDAYAHYRSLNARNKAYLRKLWRQDSKAMRADGVRPLTFKKWLPTYFDGGRY